MFNAAMGTFAEATEESIHAAIEGKFDSLENKYKTKLGNTRGGNLDCDALKKTIASLEHCIAKMAKAKHEKADGQGSSVPSNAEKCGTCGLVHGPVCWKKDRDLAPGWWKAKNPL